MRLKRRIKGFFNRYLKGVITDGVFTNDLKGVLKDGLKGVFIDYLKEVSL